MGFIADSKEAYFYMLRDWPLGSICGAIISLALLALIGLAGLGCFIAIDSWCLPTKQGMGQVVDKQFTPAHTQLVLVYNAATKISTPMPIHHPDTWTISVNEDDDDKQGNVEVDQADFEKFTKGCSVKTEYVTGRLSSGYYLKGISLCLPSQPEKLE